MVSHFKIIPTQGSPLCDRLIYAYEQEREALTIDVNVVNNRTGVVLAAQRYHNTHRFQCDIAPYLQDQVRFRPMPQDIATGIYPTDEREVEVVLRLKILDRSQNPSEPSMFHEEQSPVRCFYATAKAPGNATRLITAMPLQRLIGNREVDELLLFASTPTEVRITASGRGGNKVQTFPVTTRGMHIIALNTAEYPAAEQISVEVADGNKVGYVLARRPREAQRVAWAAACGAIEYYTFPIIGEVLRTTERKEQQIGERTYDKTRSEVRYTLRSAYEGRPVMESLSEVISSPQVWAVIPQRGVHSVKVVSDSFKIYAHGTLTAADIVIRTPQNRAGRWS